MTKRELIDRLAPFDDDQYVYIALHSKYYPDGSRVIIQGVKSSKPWRGNKPRLIGLVAHDENRELSKQATQEGGIDPTTIDTEGPFSAKDEPPEKPGIYLAHWRDENDGGFCIARLFYNPEHGWGEPTDEDYPIKVISWMFDDEATQRG